MNGALGDSGGGAGFTYRNTKTDAGHSLFTAIAAEGIHWLRMPLPSQLDHINLWLLERDDGWSIADTGIGTDVSVAGQ